MKRKLIVGIGVCLLLTGCAKEPEDSKRVNDILQEQPYVDVVMGEVYHQERVKFDRENERAVIGVDAKWGRPSFRDGDETGVYYGEEEGGEIYESEEEAFPELYQDSYFASIQNLDLLASDVKRSDYVVRVVRDEQLELFEREITELTSIIMKDYYELTGVEIEFDKECRPIRKTFQLQNKKKGELKKEHLDSEECVQEFSYGTRKAAFEHMYKKVKTEIENE